MLSIVNGKKQHGDMMTTDIDTDERQFIGKINVLNYKSFQYNMHFISIHNRLKNHASCLTPHPHFFLTLALNEKVKRHHRFLIWTPMKQTAMEIHTKSRTRDIRKNISNVLRFSVYWKNASSQKQGNKMLPL